MPVTVRIGCPRENLLALPPFGKLRGYGRCAKHGILLCGLMTNGVFFETGSPRDGKRYN
jgi:hypothetical protein